MDNCVLRCVSGRCYDAVYGADALEEGEMDVKRGRTFRSCARTELREAKQAEQQRAKAEREEKLASRPSTAPRPESPSIAKEVCV